MWSGLDDKICKGMVRHCDVLVIAMLLCMLSLHQHLIANLLFGNGITTMAITSHQIVVRHCAPLRCFDVRPVVLNAVMPSAFACKPFIQGQTGLILEPDLFTIRVVALDES